MSVNNTSLFTDIKLPTFTELPEQVQNLFVHANSYKKPFSFNSVTTPNQLKLYINAYKNQKVFKDYVNTQFSNLTESQVEILNSLLLNNKMLKDLTTQN